MTDVLAQSEGRVRLALSRVWLAYGLIALITALRIATLAFDQTDLFVDETQYWLWGQNLDFGYYSKPPLIAYMLRGITELVGHDSAFWMRAAAPVLHGITALFVVQIARRVYGPSAALWAGLAYLTLPIVAVGSYMISTDTVAAPFFAAALALFLGTWRRMSAWNAISIGVLVGVAAMAKYAGLYFYLGLALTAWIVPAARPGWRNTALMAAATLCVLAPNLIWNLGNDLVTLRHLADNADWLNDAALFSEISIGSLLSFLGSQVIAIGPVFAIGLIWFLLRPKRDEDRILLSFALAILALVSGQALLSGAFANWAFLGLLAAVPLVAGWLHRNGRTHLLSAAIALNAVVAVGLPALYIAPEVVSYQDRLVMARHLGRADMSRQILAAAERTGADAIASGHREILADLMFNGRDDPTPVYSVGPPGPARHYYDQMIPIPPDATGRFLWVDAAVPRGCRDVETIPVDLGNGAYARRNIVMKVVDADCLTARRN